MTAPSAVWIDAATRIAEHDQYEEVDGTVLDAYTARMLLTVDRALSAENRSRFRAMSLTRAVAIGWKVVG